MEKVCEVDRNSTTNPQIGTNTIRNNKKSNKKVTPFVAGRPSLEVVLENRRKLAVS